jgi:hypothetical protein
MVGTTVAAAAGRTAKTIVTNGNAKISTAQSKYGGSSLLLDGADDYLSIGSSTGGTGVIPTTGPFTVEAYIYAASFSGDFCIFSQSGDNGAAIANGSIVFAVSANKLELTLRSADANTFITGTVNLSVNTWHHVALTRDASNVFRVFQNGTLLASTLTNSIILSNNLGYDANGYIDEIRVSNTARYTATFTVPLSRFNNDSNTLLLIHADGANNSTTFTDDTGSTPATGVRFERSGLERIVVTSWGSKPTNNKVQVLSFWFKLASLPGPLSTFFSPFTGCDSSDGNLTIGTFINTSNQMVHYSHYRTGFIQSTSTTTLTTNTWYHFVAKNNGTGSGRTQVWLNGVRQVDNAAVNIGTANFLYSSVNTYTIAADNFSSRWHLDGCMEQVYWYAGDIDLDANISKFYNNGWVDMGINGTGSGLPTPHIFHSGDTQAGFDDLRGSTTGTATVTGTLSACA